jgi:peptidoglycan/LPS O-acetylase OafA/YrhL
VENYALNLLRAAAAILVVISHIRALFFLDYEQVEHTTLNTAFYLATSQGQNAVTVFFILSGYWVGGDVLHRVRTGTFTWRRYASRRLTRLWIALLPALALTAIVDAVGRGIRPTSDIYAGTPAYHDVAPMEPAAHAGLHVVLGNIFFLQSIRVPTFGSDGPLWSLAFEFAYYLLFPLAALILARRTAHLIRLFYIAVFAGVAALVGEAVLTSGLVWLLGVAIAWKADDLRAAVSGRWNGYLQILAGGGLVLGLLVAKAVGQGTFTALVTLTVPAVIFIITVLPDTQGPEILRSLVRRCSSAASSSYSLYVIHCPLVVFAAALLVPHAARRSIPSVLPILEMVALTLGCVVVAYVFALGTESQTPRVRKLLTQLSGSTRSRAAGVGFGRQAGMVGE